MVIDKPDATSTPTSYPTVQGRRGIHNKDNNSIQSPIGVSSEGWNGHDLRSRSRDISPNSLERRSPLSKRSTRSKRSPSTFNENESESQIDSDKTGGDNHFSSDDTYFDSTQPSQQPDNSENSKLNYGVCGAVVVAVCLVTLGIILHRMPEENPDLGMPERFAKLEKEIKQDIDFWRTIRVNVQEISMLKQPRSIIFLYEKNAEKTMNNILQRVSEVAACHITKQCKTKPIMIEGASLNTPEKMNDYGKIISEYGKILEKKGVMVVKNLELVSGKSARAFHSFCDDYSPVVQNALILFTMKVDVLPKGYPNKFVEDILLRLWNDLGKDDEFYPLFTRISASLLLVK